MAVASSARSGEFYRPPVGGCSAPPLSRHWATVVAGLTPLLAEASTSSALAVSGVLIAQKLPWIIGLAFGGIADRREPRSTMVTMDLLRAGLLIVLALAVLLTDVPVFVLYIAAFAHDSGRGLFGIGANRDSPDRQANAARQCERVPVLGWLLAARCMARLRRPTLLLGAFALPARATSRCTASETPSCPR